MIDLYCERIAPGFFDEPINAISNLAFFVACFGLIKVSRRRCCKDAYAIALIGLLFAIGVGSALFHTFATPWALQADVIPILLFQLVFVGSYALRVMGLLWYQVVVLLLVFLAAGFGIGKLPFSINGSESYLIPLIFLAGFGFYHYRQAREERYLLLVSAAFFMVSLGFRTLDLSLCERFSFGTHFVWHILNGAVLYLCGRAYILTISWRSREF